MRVSSGPKRFELVVQEDYLVLIHPRQPHCLLLPRALAENDPTLGITVEDANDFPELHGRRMPFDAIFGVYWLLRGPYLALVTESKVVARGIGDKEIRQATKVELMLIPTQGIPFLTPAQEEDEQRYAIYSTTKLNLY